MISLKFAISKIARHRMSGYRKFFGRPNLPYEVLLSTSPACAGREKEKTEMWEKTVRRALRGEL